MKWFQRTALWLLLGALLGSWLVLFFYPYYLRYSLPDALGKTAEKCSECVEMTSLFLRKAQLLGAAVGALAVALVGEGWLGYRRIKLKPKQETEASPPPP